MTRPVALAVVVKNIPNAMQHERRWIVWRYMLRDDRWTKLPFQPSGAMAKANDPATWTTFEAAVAAYRTGRFDGLGFCLGDGWAGVDLDKCVTNYDPKSGNLFATSDVVGPFIGALDRTNACWEVSPSRTGYKAIGRSARIGGEINFKTDPPTFTAWMGARFFAITGHFQSASSDPTVDISHLIGRWFPAREQFLDLSSTGAHDGYALAAESSDDDLLCMMVANDTNGDQILALWRGDTSAYGGDQSRADQALCCHLGFWTNYDVERIDRLFRESGLYRPKWDQESYRRATLGKAVR